MSTLTGYDYANNKTLSGLSNVYGDTLSCKNLYINGTAITSAGIVGASGPIGPTGPIGFTGPNGTSIIFIGNYNGATTYSLDSCVYSPTDKQSYISLINNNTYPLSNSLYWAIISKDGSNGPQGPQGSQGSQGPSGSDGVDGATGATGPQGAQGASMALASIALLLGITDLIGTVTLGVWLATLQGQVSTIITVTLPAMQADIFALQTKTTYQSIGYDGISYATIWSSSLVTGSSIIRSSGSSIFDAIQTTNDIVCNGKFKGELLTSLIDNTSSITITTPATIYIGDLNTSNTGSLVDIEAYTTNIGYNSAYSHIINIGNSSLSQLNLIASAYSLTCPTQNNTSSTSYNISSPLINLNGTGSTGSLTITSPIFTSNNTTSHAITSPIFTSNNTTSSTITTSQLSLNASTSTIINTSQFTVSSSYNSTITAPSINLTSTGSQGITSSMGTINIDAPFITVGHVGSWITFYGTLVDSSLLNQLGFTATSNGFVSQL